MYLQKYSHISSNSSENTKLGIKLILSRLFFFLDCPVCKLSNMYIHEVYENLRIFRKMGYKYSAANSSRIQSWYQIDTELFYSG